MTKLPEKLTLPHSQTKHAELYKSFNTLIDYLAEREGVDWAKPSETKKRSIWDLKKEDDEDYWVLRDDGCIGEAGFNSVWDEKNRENSNAFLTREAAEAERDRRREMAKGL